MKILIGLTIIAVAVAIMFAAAWVREKEKNWLLKRENEKLCYRVDRGTEKEYDYIKQLNDERKHSDMLQKELEVTEKAKDNYAAIAEDSRKKLNELREDVFAAGYCKMPNGIIHDSDGNVYTRVGTRNLKIEDGEVTGWYNPEHDVVNYAPPKADGVDE